MRLASYQVTIAAPVEVVWAHLTTAFPPRPCLTTSRGRVYFLDILRHTLSAG
jgi:hypothetical protein